MDSRRCFSPGSFAVFGGAAPPRRTLFGGGARRASEARRNGFALVQVFRTS